MKHQFLRVFSITAGLIRKNINLFLFDMLQISCNFPSLLGFNSPNIISYPIETVIAEKLEAIIARSLLTSRMKDF